MARRSAKQPAPGEWSYTVGEPPLQLTAHERPDAGNRIYTRVWDGKRIKGKSVLCAPIRDRNGRIVPDLEIAAQQAAQDRYKALQAGLEGDGRRGGPLTLARGWKIVLHPEEGAYASRTEHARDVRGYSERILKILGATLQWDQLRHAHYRKLWRALAHEYRGSEVHGFRAAERLISALRAASVWLQSEGLLEPGVGLPAPKWKEAMRREWEEITSRAVAEPKSLRYTEEESGKLWAALPDGRVDPRLWLGMEIGAELRLGQVPRSRRSDVETDETGWPVSVRVHGRGKKLGELVVLTPEQAATVHYHLTLGYLRVLEEEYQEGRLEDYFLMPGGRLRFWEHGTKLDYPIAQLKNANKPLGKKALSDWWERLEEVAGVDHMDGRRWYGIRRLQSDLAEDVEGDARVLNKLGAWSHTATRERYQEKSRRDIHQKAAETRRKIRPHSDLPDSGEGRET